MQGWRESHETLLYGKVIEQGNLFKKWREKKNLGKNHDL